MGLAYYVVPLIFQREYPWKRLARLQPYLFGFGITIMALFMSFAGSYGVPRRHWDIEFTSAAVPAGFDSTAHLMLGVMGLGAVLAFIGLITFIGLTVAAVFFGKKIENRAMTAW